MKNYKKSVTSLDKAIQVTNFLVKQKIDYHFKRNDNHTNFCFEFSVSMQHARTLNALVNKIISEKKPKKKSHADKWIASTFPINPN